MRMRVHADDEPMAEINLIPLIDISLTLVIILMVTTVFVRAPGFKLNLPRTVTHEGAPETPKDLTVSLAADGRVFFDGQQETMPQLQSSLVRAAGKNKNSRVLVKGDRTIAYQRVMDVMDAVRQAGLTQVVLPTDPKNMP
jgi:biopolymer transport protein ExbD